MLTPSCKLFRRELGWSGDRRSRRHRGATGLIDDAATSDVRRSRTLHLWHQSRRTAAIDQQLVHVKRPLLRERLNLDRHQRLIVLPTHAKVGLLGRVPGWIAAFARPRSGNLISR